nr:MAG TPA: nucleic-acid-binding protein [Bacteriophage sp.]
MILYISVYLCLHLFSCVKCNVINYYPHLPSTIREILNFFRTNPRTNLN